MRKLILFGSMMLWFNLQSIAQNAINRDDFDKLVDYVSCVYTAQYMKVIRKNDNDANTYKNDIKPKLDNCNIEKHLSHEELYALLKNNSWGDTAEKLIKTRKQNRDYLIVSDKSNDEIIDYITTIEGTFKELIGDEFIKSVKDELKAKYQEQSKSTLNEDKGITEIQLSKKEADAPRKDKNKNEGSIKDSIRLNDVLQWISILVLVFICIRLKRKNSLKIESENENIVLDREFIIQQVLNSERIEDKFKCNNWSKLNKEKLIELEKILDQLQANFNEIKLKIDNSFESSKNHQNVEASESEKKFSTKEPDTSIQNRIYLKEREGLILFKEAAKENAYYEIFNIQDNKALYRFCGDSERAKFNYDAILKDVFDDDKSFSINSNKIINTKEGIVELQADGKWEIKTVAKIKFV
jgi:hypothetical protein